MIKKIGYDPTPEMFIQDQERAHHWLIRLLAEGPVSESEVMRLAKKAAHGSSRIEPEALRAVLKNECTLKMPGLTRTGG